MFVLAPGELDVRWPGEQPRKPMPVEEKNMTDQSILWRRLDQPGHEAGRLFLQHSYWHLTGTAVFAHHQQPCRLDYLVGCDAGWQTLSGRVTGWVGKGQLRSNSPLILLAAGGSTEQSVPQ